MYAIYNKRMEEVYFCQNKRLLDMFLNDRCRSKKDFLVEKVDDTKFTGHDIWEIEYKEIIETYGCERAITRDEADFFDEFQIHEIFAMRKNLENLIKTSETLRLSKEEKVFCDNIFNRYYKFLTDIIEYEYGDEEECYDWIVKFCNLNAIYDVIINNWTGKL